MLWRNLIKRLGIKISAFSFQIVTQVLFLEGIFHVITESHNQCIRFHVVAAGFWNLKLCVCTTGFKAPFAVKEVVGVCLEGTFKLMWCMVERYFPAEHHISCWKISKGCVHILSLILNDVCVCNTGIKALFALKDVVLVKAQSAQKVQSGLLTLDHPIAWRKFACLFFCV